MFGSYFKRKRNAVYTQVESEIEKYKKNNLQSLFSAEFKNSVIFDQWGSIATNLKNGLSKLRAHIYEVREEYTSVVITYNKEKNTFVVVEFTVGRSRKSLPWSVKHHISNYPITGWGAAQRNETALAIVENYNIKDCVKASFL